VRIRFRCGLDSRIYGNKFEILKNLDAEDSIDNDINAKWENIKIRIKETKQQLIEKDECIETFKNKGYDEKCKFALEEMKKAKEKWLIKGKGRRKGRNITVKEKTFIKQLGLSKGHK
jgi:hypothetical protein